MQQGFLNDVYSSIYKLTLPMIKHENLRVSSLSHNSVEAFLVGNEVARDKVV